MHHEPAITDDMTIDDSETHSTHSITLQKMMAEQVQPDIFDPPCHKLKPGIQSKLDALLKEYETQFAKDETSIRTTPLTEMTINTGDSEPCITKTIPYSNEELPMGKRRNWEITHSAKVIHSSRSSWSAPIIVVPKGDRGKWLVIDYRALNKVTWKFTWPMPKVEDIFSKLNWQQSIFQLWIWEPGYHHIPLDKSLIPKTAFNSPFGKYEYVKVPFRLAQAPAYFQELMTGILKDFNFTIAYLDDIIIFS